VLTPSPGARRLTWLMLAVAAMALLSAILPAEILVGLVTCAVFFALLYGNAALAWRLVPRDVLMVVDDSLGLPCPEVLEPYLRRLTLPVSATP
jgi:hypothetical protein